MHLQPVYTPKDVSSPAYHLRYTWSGWPSSSTFPAVPSAEFFQELDALWENDGMRRLEMSWSAESIQMAFSVTPQVMNNLAYAFGQNPIWQPSYYAGTFGDYDMAAVRRNGKPFSA